MTTAQDPPVRNKQKRRRTKQLAEWRAKHPGAQHSKPADAGKSTKSAKK